ncbi:MAG TPA: phage DNA encapsidation protein [Weissella thailandensis]|uniref:phage DNA encapsidation protein n=1 Tax=Weissella thailandensis TaxID=89061 RepID=UPI001D8947D4|nr:phage DNA encapsidation protein [Weissella thailandensis]HJG85391.1 phage DNA encapsidation protein [Weissella thailandensis]
MTSKYIIKEKSGLKHINVKLVKSYNAQLNLITGPRGTGKTYGFLKDMMLDIVKHLGEVEGMLITRKQIEMLEATDNDGANFLGDIWREHAFDNFVFRKRNSRFIDVGEKVLDENGELDLKSVTWYTAFRLIYLSGSVRRSVAYPNVKYVLFDEFQITDGSNYLPNEFSRFRALLNTVMRKRTDVKVYLLSNAGSIINPYFEAFGYVPNKEQETWRKRIKLADNQVTILILNVMPDEEDVLNNNLSGALAVATAGGHEDLANSYGYSVDFIAKLSDKARPSFNFIIDGEQYVCYNERIGNVIDNGFNPNSPITYSDDFMTGESMRAHAMPTLLVRQARKGRLYFTTQQTREKLTHFINRLF